MARKAPAPTVRFVLDPQFAEEEKILRQRLSEAHILAIHSFISSLNLSAADKKAMKKMLS